MSTRPPGGLAPGLSLSPSAGRGVQQLIHRAQLCVLQNTFPQKLRRESDGSSTIATQAPRAPRPGPQTRRPWGYTVWGFWVLHAPHPVWAQEGQEPVADPWPGVLACRGQGQGTRGQVISREQPLWARPRADGTIRLNRSWSCAQSYPTLPHSSQPPRGRNRSLSIPHQDPRPGLGGSCGASRAGSRQQHKQMRRPAQRAACRGHRCGGTQQSAGLGRTTTLRG